MWKQGHWPWCWWFKCLLGSNIWPRKLSLCCSDTAVNGPSSSLQERDRLCALLLWNPALPSELRDQQCAFPVAQSSWHVGTPYGLGKVHEPVIALALLLYFMLLILWGDTKTACFILLWFLFLKLLANALFLRLHGRWQLIITFFLINSLGFFLFFLDQTLAAKLCFSW